MTPLIYTHLDDPLHPRRRPRPRPRRHQTRAYPPNSNSNRYSAPSKQGLIVA